MTRDEEMPIPFRITLCVLEFICFFSNFNVTRYVNVGIIIFLQPFQFYRIIRLQAQLMTVWVLDQCLMILVVSVVLCRQRGEKLLSEQKILFPFVDRKTY